MDYNSYIGLPYESNGRTRAGVDCWGLVRLFYREQLGLELPDYSELYSGSWDPQLSDVIDQHKSGWSETQDAQPGDVCLFNIYGEPAHVGVYLGARRFLHAREGRDSVVESLDSPQWSRRFGGFYRYQAQATEVMATGLPHPLRTQVNVDWMPAGTTVQNFADYVVQKYSVSQRLASKTVVLLDGVPVPRDQWSTTVLQPDQKVAYKCVAEGRDTTRLLLTLAVVVVAANFGPQVGSELGKAVGVTSAAGQAALGSAIINMAGMALINAIAPIRMPGQNDPGQARGLNLFTGASNQANRFGAIPVVLGRLRVTGTLGATPYVDTLTDTSLLNLLVIWGFGPLEIRDICVGTSPIENYYNKPLTQAELEQQDLDWKTKGVVNQTPEFAQDIPRPVTLSGTGTESLEETEAFNRLYPQDVEQQQVGVELVNNAQDGNPWQEVVLQQTTTKELDIAFSFPQGMRQIVISGKDAGQVREATAAVEIQVRKKTGVTWPEWQPRATYTLSAQTGTNGTSRAFVDTLGPVTYYKTVLGTGDNGASTQSVPLYQWYTYALSSTGEIKRFDGAATEQQNSEPSAQLLADLQASTYASLLGTSTTPTRLPQVPLSGYQKLYTLCTYGGQIVATTNHLSGYLGYSGLVLTTELKTATIGSGDSIESVTTGTEIRISAGAISQLSSLQPETGTVKILFDAATLTGTTRVTNGVWGTFLNSNGVWKDTGTEFVETQTVTFTESGYYKVEAAADDEGAIYVDNRLVVAMPRPGYHESVSNLVYLEAGTYPVKVTARNSGGGAAGVACKITYTADGAINNLPNADTILQFGSPGFYHKRRDAFNFVYKIKNLEEGTYEVRVRRVDSDEKEPSEELRNYNTVSLLSVTAKSGSDKPPLNKLPRGNLARTAIRIQSTNKANGSVDGVNALVHTIALDYDYTTQSWAQTRATSNPASLFLYVLTHPANAYRITEAELYEKIDMTQLASWHDFCRLNAYEYNAVLTQTQSVLDTLRDICAAGLASPSFVDGKWTVIVDRPRTYVTQHFTPHNSWGFESTKLLPRLPDAFRVTFPDRDRAYQANEIIVYNFGKTETTASVFEELSLPGVTNARQAKRLARWHLAQLKLRPEVYTLNADFEYLVCNRGDLVLVNHDVPLWGTGSGRLKSVGETTIGLTESVYLVSGTTYQVRIRTNTGASVLRTVAPVTTGWYSTVTLTVSLAGSGVEVDNLFMIGEVSKESQQLIVLGIEPSSNVTARLTLADYSPEIYAIDLDSDSELPSFQPNISNSGTEVVQNTITQSPVISGITSSVDFAVEISRGVYENSAVVNLSDVTGLTDQAKIVEVQVVLGNADFTDSSSITHRADKSSGSVSIRGLRTGTTYKLRARYTNTSGTVVGPWSRIYYFVNSGKDTNYYVAPLLDVILEGTDIVVTVPNEYKVGTTFFNLQKPEDFKVFEYRLYKDTGIEDFWDIAPTEQNAIKVVQSVGEARFSLLGIPLPRISQQGVTYRVACRAVDVNNNYSAESVLGTIVVKTIT